MIDRDTCFVVASRKTGARSEKDLAHYVSCFPRCKGTEAFQMYLMESIDLGGNCQNCLLHREINYCCSQSQLPHIRLSRCSSEVVLHEARLSLNRTIHEQQKKRQLASDFA